MWSSTGGDGLIGREREQRELREHLAAACGGDARLVVVQGPAGIGKSALLAALRPAATETGARWLGARGSELERDFPFGVVRQLLEPAVAAEREGVLRGAASLAATVLGAPSDDAGTAEPGYAVLHGLFWLVANLADRSPLVLCVDDVQWADAPSLRFLDHLGMRLDGMPVLVLLAARAGAAALTLGPIARLIDQPGVALVSVDGLEREAVATLVRRRLGPEAGDELVGACHEVTRGNPFLLREILGELERSAAGGRADPAAVGALAPPAIVRALRLRLEALSPPAVALARAAAILGADADIRTASELAQLTPETAQAAAEELVAADILLPERPLTFTHAVVASAAREAMSLAERSRLHRRAAAMVARRPGGLDAAAGHLLAVDPGGDAEAARVLREAAAVARHRGAADAASTYLRRALVEPPAPEDLGPTLVDLAAAAGYAGEKDALVFAERALEVTGDPRLRLQAAREAALIHITAGRPEAAADMMAAVLEAPELGMEERTAGEGVLLVAAVIAAAARRRHAGRIEAARRMATELGDAAPAALLVLAGFELVVVDGRPRDGLALLERALAGGRLLREVTSDSPFPYIAGNALIVAGRYGLAEATVTDVIVDAARRGSIRAAALATAQRGLCRIRAGSLRSGEADARASLDMGEGRTLVQLTVAVAALAGALTDAGEHAGAHEALAMVPPEARRPDFHVGAVVEDIRGRLHADEGRWDEVLATCEASAAWEREFGVAAGGWPAWRGLAAQAHAALGDPDRAHALAMEGLELARAFGVPRTLGLALRGAALVRESPADRVELLGEALEVLDRGGVRYEAARTAADLGQALAAAGRRDEARRVLARALGDAERVGSAPVEQRARDALVALGSRPRRRTTSGAQALTAGERRVAELAARGVSNREIAEQLFLTAKTVENHLTSTYRKLGISSRAQLADRLG